MTAPMSAEDRRAAAKAAQQVVRLTFQGDTLDLAVGLIPVALKAKVRAQTGRAFETFLTEFGEDSLVVLWWLARVQYGEHNLSYKEVEQAWPRPLIPGDFITELVIEDDGDGVEPNPEG